MATQKDRYQLEIETRQAAAGLSRLSTLMKAFAGVIAVRELAQFGQTIIRTTSELQTLRNSLRLVTLGTEDLARVTAVLRAEAIKNRTSFADTVDLFVKLRVSTEELGIAEERIIAVTGKLSQALQVAGADAATTNAVIRQFGQAMASGEVRGDEFRSIVEGLGPALAIMARESGITVGELRKMSQAGELTAERMFEIFENSEALTGAFQRMQPTLSQLETQFGDTFDLALEKLGEVSGLTQGYENALKRLNRILADFADAPGSLADLDPGDIFKQAREGAISLDAAIYELSERLRNDNWTLGLSLSGEEEEAIEGILAQLTILKIERDAAAKVAEEAANKEAAALKKQQEALAAVLAPHKRFIEQAKKFAETDYRTELEKANQRVIDAEIVIEQLNLAMERSNGQVEDFAKLLRGAQKELEDATAKVKKLREESNKPTGFDKFYKDLIDDSEEVVETLEFIEKAQRKLIEAHMQGAISSDVLAEAMQRLNSQQKALLGDFDLLAKSTNDFISNMVDSTADMQQEFDTLNMNPLEKQLSDIAYNLTKDANRQITELKETIDDFDGNPEAVRRINEQVERVRTATAAQIEQQQALAKAQYEAQRSFASGWAKAFQEYEDEATNAAKNAERIFAKTTKGMEDMIVNFAKTGKFEFKSFVASILEDLLRAQIQQSIAQIFRTPLSGGGTAGSGLGNIFGGFFANGGFLPSGKIGVVGESGPELISGPANITPLDGVGGNVTYNINAVDALSFRQLVARDPGFIHAVAQKGGSAVPSGR
jgi:tape measure domain-containing protein